MAGNKLIWLKDIHHSPYLVIEGELRGAINNEELLNLLSSNFTKVDINNSGDAFSLDADTQVVFSIGSHSCAVCYIISRISEEPTDYLELMSSARQKLDQYIIKLESVLDSAGTSIKFRELYLQDPIRYM